ncbi:MAG: hydantoinase B/oxoprolinase family protein [Cyanobacteria bacterium]|nr:hydantoinase B/oxoprolinase family protein [Cyanobacteriota bacterium]MDA1020004.1 hydantoinase B/oxoprolinase family protein [Cyanobacteriota bacterium]
MMTLLKERNAADGTLRIGSNYQFFIDRGGTFTDCYAVTDKGSRIIKLLSVDPMNYADAPREAIRRVLLQDHDLAILKDPYKPFPTSCDHYHIETIRMGTTVATNALLEHQGAKFAFITTSGFADLLEIAYQNRPKIFDLEIIKVKQLYSRVIELDERILVSGVEKELDLDQVCKQLQELLDAGIDNLAIALMHSYANPQHELRLKDLAQSMGFKQVSISSEISPMIKIVPRADTTCIDAYLSPVLKQYVNNFKNGFSDGLAKTQLMFMKSDAGLTKAESFAGYNSILSGPAGGVVALSSLRGPEECGNPVIGFDMGGTSTDVSRYAGEFEMSFESEINGHRIQAPQLDIKTVAAGGGSRLFYDNGMFRVGPESAGADPGPVSYGKGGHLAITDANLVLGRLIPEYFPQVFGRNADQPLDKAAAIRAFEELREENNLDLTIEEIASGFIKVANEIMARPIREISIMKGHDIKTHSLACFGGAGGQHACAIARDLGINKVIIHKYSGILSAYGLALADEVVERQKPASLPGATELRRGILELEAEFSSLIEGIEIIKQCIIIKYLNLRYQGTDTQFMIKEPEDGDYSRAFKEQYLREFGFDLTDREILVDDVRVRVVKSSALAQQGIGNREKGLGSKDLAFSAQVYFDKWYEVPVYLFGNLGFEQEIMGPAIIMQDTATLVIEPESTASLNSDGNLEIQVKPYSLSPIPYSHQIDPVSLTIFANRFMSIAEQMGRSLQKTSISTNIKERLDFSCAIFDQDAGLVANAPHQPVHLGSMGHAVSKQVQGSEIQVDKVQSGDSFLTNHPAMGGSHLPDLTVITPVFPSSLRYDAASAPIFYVANRAHHADIGGISPGSMPSFSTSLDQEGVAIKSFKLVDAGEFQEQSLRELLSSSRTLEDNISDLRAQVAANKKGIELIEALIAEFGQEPVAFYMKEIQANAEEAVRSSLRASAKQSSLEARDYLDDGSVIKLKVEINQKTGSAIFDFTGTAARLKNNLNTPEAVTSSAILYALRAMINKEIPLNQGCLKPITIVIPEGSLLKPPEDAAVVAGNVLTSQRIVDVIFKAFGTCAASQGCMNNISFGNDHFGYYETIGGGAGAGPTWHGASGVHTHMTNTRITDPEILETRYPVILREFSIRKGSGGQGKFKGGDGLVRVFEFLDNLQVSILTERRVYAPYGMAGGEDGARGENRLDKADGSSIQLEGKCSIDLAKTDRLRVLTPGAGGYGES